MSRHLPISAQFGDAFLGAQHRLCGRRPQGANRFRPDGGKLPEQKLAANLHLIRLRRAIFRGPALHHVADVDVVPRDDNSFLLRGAVDHLRKKLSGPSDKRQSLRVLISPRAFSHEHQPGLFIA